jgi:hypothetical protein
MPFDVGGDDREDDRALKYDQIMWPREHRHLSAGPTPLRGHLANIAKFLADDHKTTFDRMF